MWDEHAFSCLERNTELLKGSLLTLAHTHFGRFKASKPLEYEIRYALGCSSVLVCAPAWLLGRVPPSLIPSQFQLESHQASITLSLAPFVACRFCIEELVQEQFSLACKRITELLEMESCKQRGPFTINTHYYTDR